MKLMIQNQLKEEIIFCGNVFLLIKVRCLKCEIRALNCHINSVSDISIIISQITRAIHLRWVFNCFPWHKSLPFSDTCMKFLKVSKEFHLDCPSVLIKAFQHSQQTISNFCLLISDTTFHMNDQARSFSDFKRVTNGRFLL